LAAKTTRRTTPIPRLAQNRAESVYRQLKDDIFEFRLMPGMRFSENEVAARASVSRTPVREALMRLAREGFVSVHPRSGWTVRPLDFEQFDHLYDVRVILELAALARIALRTDAAPALDALRQTWLVPARQRLAEERQVAVLDEAFHATLVRAAGNPELARLHQDVTERIRIIRRLDFTQPGRIAATYDEHAAILRAVSAGKTQQAALLLRSHIEHSRLEVRKISLHRLHVAHATARSDPAPARAAAAGQKKRP
jgi:DNA-binding GntR family transcriptional regulator